MARAGQNPAWRMVKRTVKTLTFKRLRKRRLKDRITREALAALAQFPRHPQAPRHRLPGELVISLTSYPARYPTLHLTLMSIIDQRIRPDRIVLWIAHDHMAELPDSVTSLQGELFEIRPWDDIRNFKKIVPALTAFPDAFIIIADDDTYYPDDWLEQLVDAYDPADPTIVCHRAHRPTYLADGSLAPYRQWHRAVSDRATYRPQTGLLPTGNGGVLYPPGSLPPETTDLSLIRKLSATSDDVWLFFMWRKAGWRIKRVPRPLKRFIEWPNSQSEASLRIFHTGGKKDEHLQDMCRHYGVP